MKKFIAILFLLFLSVPAFATAGWYEGCNDNIEGYDVSEEQQYYEELVKAFDKKYHYYDEQGRGVTNAPKGAFQREVEVPYYEYLSKHPPKYKYPEQILPSQSPSSQYPEELRKKNKETLDRLRREQQKKEILRRVLSF